MANVKAFERREYQQVKADLHRKILDRLDLEKLGRTPGATAREEVLVLIRNTVNSEAVPLSFAERERLAREILDEIFGLGPLEPLLKDQASRIFWSTVSTRCTWSAPASWNPQV